jgi:RNA polymerase sigma-70 factor (ECF subfamily)
VQVIVSGAIVFSRRYRRLGETALAIDETRLAALMRSAIAGDERAYADFLSATASAVRALVRRRLPCDGGIDVEDVVQETLLAVHLKRHTWRPDEAIVPWLAAIARHKAVDAYRRRGSRIEIDVDDMVDILPAPEPEIATTRDVGRALDTLAPGQRRVVTAVAVQGVSIREAAASLGMTEVAVRVALHRGLTAIRTRLGVAA